MGTIQKILSGITYIIEEIKIPRTVQGRYLSPVTIRPGDSDNDTEPFFRMHGGETRGRGVNLRGVQRLFFVNQVKIILFPDDAGLLLQYPIFSTIDAAPKGRHRGG